MPCFLVRRQITALGHPHRKASWVVRFWKCCHFRRCRKVFTIFCARRKALIENQGSCYDSPSRVGSWTGCGGALLINIILLKTSQRVLGRLYPWNPIRPSKNDESNNSACSEHIRSYTTTTCAASTGAFSPKWTVLYVKLPWY